MGSSSLSDCTCAPGYYTLPGGSRATCGDGATEGGEWCDDGPFPLKWVEIGTQQPTTGTEIFNTYLARTLQPSQWPTDNKYPPNYFPDSHLMNLEVSDVPPDSFILAQDGKYYKPAGQPSFWPGGNWDGDGCSSSCTIEAGWKCSLQGSGATTCETLSASGRPTVMKCGRCPPGQYSDRSLMPIVECTPCGAGTYSLGRCENADFFQGQSSTQACAASSGGISQYSHIQVIETCEDLISYYTGASGLRWDKVTEWSYPPFDPSVKVRYESAELETYIDENVQWGMCEISQGRWDAFGITDLNADHYVQLANGDIYKPFTNQLMGASDCRPRDPPRNPVCQDFTLEEVLDHCCVCSERPTTKVKFDRAQKCGVCPTGKYSIGPGQDRCLDCSDGRSTAGPGSVGIDSCGFCGAGLEWRSQELGCVACPSGTYKEFGGSASCTGCSVAFQPEGGGNWITVEQTTLGTAKGGSTSASDCMCGPGYYGSLSDVGTLDQVPDDETGMPKQVSAVSIAGATVTALAYRCRSCPAGKYGSEGGQTTDANCTSCEPGSFSPNIGASTCTLCPVGTFSAQPGAVSCSAMSGGGTSMTSCDSTAPCDTGYTCSDSGTCIEEFCVAEAHYADVCVLCPAGKASSGRGSTEDTCCAPGKGVQVIGAQVGAPCLPCAPGEYQDLEGSESCLSCPAGKTSLAGAAASTACFNDIKCLAGEYAFSAQECRQCPWAPQSCR